MDENENDSNGLKGAKMLDPREDQSQTCYLKSEKGLHYSKSLTK